MLRIQKVPINHLYHRVHISVPNSQPLPHHTSPLTASALESASLLLLRIQTPLYTLSRLHIEVIEYDICLWLTSA